MNLYRSKFRSGISNCISVAFRPRSDQPFTSLYCFSGLRGSVDSPLSQNIHSCSQACQSKVVRSEIIGFPVLENLSRKFASVKVKENLPLPCALSFRSFIHYGNPKQPENGSISRSMDFVSGIIEENGHDRFGGPQFAHNDVEQNADVVHNKMLRSNRFGGPQFGGPQFAHIDVEQNADVVHIKMLRNNTFITVTDSKGNKKPGEGVSASAGSLPDKGGKVSRYGAEATAEHCGREARKSGIKSVVVKVNGFTYFKKKRQAVMAFREGYTHGRGDQTPIVYIEDTTRRPHNGCRLRKKRRI